MNRSVTDLTGYRGSMSVDNGVQAFKFAFKIPIGLERGLTCTVTPPTT